MSRAIQVAMACLAIGIATTPVTAGLISTNDAHFGAGAITNDTATGLEWLDLTFTNGLSYNFVSTQFGSGGQFEGFRYATSLEVDTLFRDAGFSHTDRVYRIEDQLTARTLLGLVATTPPLLSVSFAFGITGEQLIDPFDPSFSSHFRFGISYAWTLLPDHIVPEGYADGLEFHFFRIADDLSAPGSWLVRDNAAAVPEPGSLTLFGLGTLGLIGAARRRRQS